LTFVALRARPDGRGLRDAGGRGAVDFRGAGGLGAATDTGRGAGRTTRIGDGGVTVGRHPGTTTEGVRGPLAAGCASGRSRRGSPVSSR